MAALQPLSQIEPFCQNIQETTEIINDRNILF